MSFQKPCHMPFRKLIPPFTLTVMTSHALCCVPNNFRNSPKTFHFAFRHVCLHSRPPNNPINARAPSLGPRLSLFSEVSYWVNYDPLRPSK